MGLAALLGRTLRSVNRALHGETSGTLFRRADRCRNQGQYDEAALLVARGLREAPGSTVGHLISAYLHVARRQSDRAKREFQRVLALDPYHPRALVGLARICIEEQDLEGATAMLDRSLGYYPEFAEALALRATLARPGPAEAAERSDHPRGDFPGEPGTPTPERDVVAIRTDGRLVFARTDEDRGRQLTQHLTQVYRTASATLSRAGLGSLRSAAIDTGSCMTFLLREADLVFSATLDGHVEVGVGLARIGRLRTDLGIKA